jgi:hypothetical protein
MTMYRNNGDPGDPAEPDEIEILKIEANGADITDLISEAEYEYIETYLFENWQSSAGDDLADHKYQQWKDRDLD